LSPKNGLNVSGGRKKCQDTECERADDQDGEDLLGQVPDLVSPVSYLVTGEVVDQQECDCHGKEIYDQKPEEDIEFGCGDKENCNRGR